MHVMIVGTRGVPAMHGGFETFAEDLSLFLAERNHYVTVYCQANAEDTFREDNWNGVHRVLIPSSHTPLGTVLYDWETTKHAAKQDGIVLTLGYNTGIFSLRYRMSHVPNLMNMDGIEWKREKWSLPQRAWLLLNEWAGARCAHHLIADHPEIATHLGRHTSAGKITIIPYGADPVRNAPAEVIEEFGLASKDYYLVIARPEPENSILEIVRTFSQTSIRAPLVVLGRYSRSLKYHQQVLDEAGPSVRFLGPVYDRSVVKALRCHAKAYLHGHRVGGTNPSLVESLACGNAVVAHDNRFTRWVAGQKAMYFRGTSDLEEIVTSLEESPQRLMEMEDASRLQHQFRFEKGMVLACYEQLLIQACSQYSKQRVGLEVALPRI